MDPETFIERMRIACQLAGCVIREEPISPALAVKQDSDQLLDAANGHMLAAITAFALQMAGVNTPRVCEEVGQGFWRTGQLEADWQWVRLALDEAGIWYCPLKGAVIKDLYPSFGMRQMSDYDVLFDATRSDEVRAIMEKLGFSCEAFGRFHHDVYHKPPITNFEMHRYLFSERKYPALAHYYATIKDRLVKDPDNNCGWHMSIEDCYVYLLAHEYKHFAASGTGLRSVLDLYVYLRAYEAEMDWDEVRRATRALEIEDFEQQQRTFAKHLFDNAQLSPDEEELFAYLATSGAYGVLGHSVTNRLDAMGDGALSKIRYLFRRVFLPMDSVKEAYPFFYKHKILLPGLVLFRMGRAASKRRRQVMHELRLVMHYRSKAKAD